MLATCGCRTGYTGSSYGSWGRADIRSSILWSRRAAMILSSGTPSGLSAGSKADKKSRRRQIKQKGRYLDIISRTWRQPRGGSWPEREYLGTAAAANTPRDGGRRWALGCRRQCREGALNGSRRSDREGGHGLQNCALTRDEYGGGCLWWEWGWHCRGQVWEASERWFAKYGNTVI